MDLPLDSWRKRAERALGKHEVGEVAVKVLAIVGAAIPASEPLAQAAWDKLRNGDPPTPQEMEALEIVIRMLRPAPLSLNQALEDLPETDNRDLYPTELKDLWASFRHSTQPLLYSIGRIEKADGTHVGTGFLVAPDVLATNRHVLDELTWGTGLLAAAHARINFQREDGANDKPEHIVSIEGALGFHPSLDIALLKIPSQDRPVVEVDVDAAAVSEGHRVAAIGYPARDDGRNPAFAASIFANRYGVKRAAIGEVLDGLGNFALFHDCSTLGGNSGSPVFSLTTGKVIAIHRAGFFMYRNEAVNGDALGRYLAASLPPQD